MNINEPIHPNVLLVLLKDSEEQLKQRQNQMRKYLNKRKIVEKDVLALNVKEWLKS